jgi:hypothetical protein
MAIFKNNFIRNMIAWFTGSASNRSTPQETALTDCIFPSMKKVVVPIGNDEKDIQQSELSRHRSRNEF